VNKGLLDTDILSDNRLELVTGNFTHYQRIQQLGYPLTLVSWR
jgi:hypothetical protein